MFESFFRVILVCAVTAALLRFLPGAWRRKLLPLVAVSSSVAAYGRAFIAVLAVILVVWLVAKLIAALEGKGESTRWHAALVSILALSLIFLIGRGLTWHSETVVVGPSSLAWFAMDMWLVLRLVTFFWEVGSGAIKPSFATYLAWCFLPFWIFGPVFRYAQFDSQLKQIDGPIDVAERVPDWLRLSLLSVAQISLAILLTTAQPYVEQWHSVYPKTVTLLSGLTFLPLGFYLGAAGYFHAMEVLGGVAGFKLPPSFRNPLMKRNISEFWSSWNMSATSVFRDYMYYNRWGLQKHHQYLNLTMLFLAVGLWHGSNSYWIIWGGMHAVGFCVFTWFNRHPSSLRTWFGESRVGRPAATVISYVFVCSCWILPPTLMHLAGLSG